MRMTSTIYLSGGCFWGVEAFLKKLYGVKKTTCGYANSKKANPSYEEVCSGKYEAVECVEVVYEASELSLKQLLFAFFSIIDPTSQNQQGGDVGIQYRTGVYYIHKDDEALIQQELSRLQDHYDVPIVTEVLALHNFYCAETYHQNYLEVNPNGYCHLNLAQAYACVEAMGIALKK